MIIDEVKYESGIPSQSVNAIINPTFIKERRDTC